MFPPTTKSDVTRPLFRLVESRLTIERACGWKHACPIAARAAHTRRSGYGSRIPINPMKTAEMRTEIEIWTCQPFLSESHPKSGWDADDVRL
ncbi:MAG: hypothetical protein A4E38_00290 [Methanoregulaceae archaeon PtaB.Bin108]|nr:MAG: hypothetical protein A4E38_00290 [Methanoregulaceae archaeon PtaB.Bin108]